ncbi:MAG TPA: CoF synthetase [Leeuwenhoekiella sp.]|nr:CoF synthetase [Leeuwenhoekiella sp.]
MVQSLLEKMRKYSFWSLDFLKGGRVRSHYKDIAFILENYTSEASQNRRDELLHNLLTHAVSTTVFYAPFKNFKTLSDFPVINKSIIRDHKEDVLSSTYMGKNNREISTSGSSGTPFTTLQNKAKEERNTADTIYFKKKAGFEVGYRLYYIRKWFKMHTKSNLTTWLRNIKMVDVTEFSDEYLSDFITTVKKDDSTKVFLAYSSALREICNYLERTGATPIKADISCIIAMSEALSDRTRAQLEKYFDAPVLSRYSNLENGILSLQLPGGGDLFHINWASYYIEILHPDKDIPVAHGEVGRVVVTDLFNHCMPMIRYDTGDLAIMSGENEYFNGAPGFLKVEGRKMDVIYKTDGRIQSPFIIFHLEPYADIKQFQLIQEERKKYILKLNVEQGFDKGQELIAMLKSYLGTDADVQIDFVQGIPQLSSGKRRLTVNNYLKEKIDESLKPQIENV